MLTYLIKIKKDDIKIQISDQYWHISTDVNNKNDGNGEWNDFKSNYYVHTTKEEYNTKEVERGDVILVRCGQHKTKAIGIVYNNRGKDDPKSLIDGKTSLIDVLWITKKKS